MAQFLDTNGLKTLINEIKTFVNNKFSKCVTSLGGKTGDITFADKVVGKYNVMFEIADKVMKGSVDTGLKSYTVGGKTINNQSDITFAEVVTKEGEVYFTTDENGYILGNVSGLDNKVDREDFAVTLGVEAGQPITSADGVYNYLNNNSSVALALETLDGELKNVENKVNNSGGGSVDLTDVNDKISKLEGGVESLNTKSDVNDNAHELYNELMIFNNLLETQDFSNNWVCYDEGYNEIENGIESKSFNVPATTYNGLPVYGLSNKAYEDEALYIYSKQSLNITKPGKYVFSFYCDYYDTNTDDFNLTIGLWDESNNEYAKTITEDGVKIESTGSSYNGNLNLIKLNFEITEDDLSYFINDETNNPYDVCVKIEFNRNVGGGRLNFTPFMLHCVNQNQDLNEVLEPITSSIDTLTSKVSTNSVAINEQKEMIDNIKGSCCKLIHLNMDFSTGSGNLTVDDLNNINNTEYPNIIAHISGSYDPAKAQGVNLTGGDEVLYKFETVTYINKLDDSAVAHVQGCLTDMAGGFPGIYSYYININLKEIGETPAGYWNVTNGGVKMF